MDDEFRIPGMSIRIPPDQFPDPVEDPPSPAGVAVLAGGCFWCVEAVYRALDGVESVVSGYAGGTAETADYRTVCSGTTDHAEAVEVRFDPQQTPLGEILKLFFAIAHDPTQLNRQGNDRGRQYRSAIFYADEAQRQIAQAYIDKLTEIRAFRDPIVTTLERLDRFYPAETYHQDYAARNPDQPYIAATAAPKLDKLRAYYGERLKS